MRLNKKLAALTMSVVMVASNTAPVTVFASGIQTEVQDPCPAGWTILGERKGRFFGKSDSYAVYHSPGRDYYGIISHCTISGVTNDIWWPAAGMRSLNGTMVDAKVTIQGQDYVGTIEFNDKLTSTNWKKDISVVTKAATCEETGRKNIVDYLLVPGAELNADNTANEADIIKMDIKDQDVEIPALGHDFGEAVITYEAGQNTEIKDGKPVLKDEEQNGTYTEISTKTCSICGEEVVTREEKTLSTEVVDPTTAKVTAFENIAYVLVKEGDEEVKESIDGLDADKIPSDESKFVLIDCHKEGSYTVTAYTTAGEVSFNTTKKVAAHHHAVKSIELKDEADKDLCTVDQEKLTVKSNVCNKDIAYYIVTNCDCEKHGKKTELSREEKTAPASTVHNINKELKKELTKEGFALDQEAYEALKDEKNAKAQGIKVGDSTATCQADGEVEVTFLCNVCGKEVETIKVKVLKHEAVAGTPELVTIKEATCQEEGLAKRIVKCTICGTELSSTDVPIKKLAHTNEDGKDVGAEIELVSDSVLIAKDNKTEIEKDDYVISYSFQMGYRPTARVFTTCSRCGEKQYIRDLEKETEEGKAGSITLEATYETKDEKESRTLTKEITVPYYSNFISYLDRVNEKEKPEEELKNGLVKDADDKWRLYKDGVFQENFTGITEYKGGEFFIANGELCDGANGLNLFDGTWYFLSQGQIQRGYDGFAEYDGHWFMIQNGELNENANGLYDYNGGTFLFAAGKLRDDVNGLWQDAEGTWWFLANGQVQKQHTGVAEYDGQFFYVVDGKLATSFNGTVEYDGATFRVVAGQLYEKVA